MRYWTSSCPSGRSECARPESLRHSRQHKTTDHTDVRRCLEIARAAGVTTEAFTDSDEMLEGADLVRSLFSDRHGPGMSGMSEDLGLSETAADQRYTRIRGLIHQVLGS